MAIISSYSLRPFADNLKDDEILHLLRRCLLGVGHKELSFFKGKSLDQCLNILLQASPAPAPALEELSDGVDQNPAIKVGGTWIHEQFENEEVNYRRKLMFRMWWTGLIINRDFSLTEKMTLFWHNHFVTETDVVKDSRYSYYYVAMLRSHALGNFKKLIREGTTTPAMLVYLGGSTNFKSAPNENFARELMELFTLGKGYGVQYTEDDVKAAARVLTGWHDDKEHSIGIFDPLQHEDADKHFSSFFGNTIIRGRQGVDGACETDELIEMILKKKEAARYVCRNLYRWFTYAHVDSKIEQQIILPLAEIYYRNNFEILPVLKTLLGSEHFFDPAFRGCIVKSPVDFLIGSAQQIGMKTYYAPAKTYTNLVECHEPWLQYFLYCEDLSMRIGDPPSVAGWAAYYQAPNFHRWWVNSASLSLRKKITDGLCTHEGLKFNGYYMSFDFLSFARQFQNPEDLDDFVQQCTDLLCAVPLSTSSIAQLKESLVSGMETNYYWKKAWTKLAADPDDKETKEVIEARLRMYFAKLFSMPEYHMM
jgi:uncharacterized protein (DUF1800 family)